MESKEKYVIEMLNITKEFPGIKANDNVTLQVKKGEIHALLGENGAGKSTLMSVLFGLYQPEEGIIKKDGKEIKINSPNDANALNIGMVHQHFKLVECFTVLDNIILGVEPNKFGFLKKDEARKKVMELSEKYKLKVDPDALISDISVGMQQRVEILKMLYRDNEILIFDEPTAVLTPQEIDELMNIMRDFTKEGKSIIFITHKLNEIMAVADRCTVLRKGKGIGTVEIKNTTKEELSKMMVGRDVKFTVDKEEFKAYMNAQKELARKNRKLISSMNLQNELLINYKEESKFVGYDKLGLETEVLAIMKDNNFVDTCSEDCYIFLKENPFYAESGGQVSDSGYLKNDKCKLEVTNVIKAPNGQHLLEVKVLEGTINKGDKILTHVSKEKRLAIMKNHSAAHLLQKSLQELLGDAVHQAGSKVDEESLRFDFTYQGKLSDELILKVENLVNDKIQAGYETNIEYMNFTEAKEKGAMALFSDKYGSTVRVVTMGPSIELCAGTHVSNTKDINKFAIAIVENKGADTYRIIGATDTNIPKVLEEEIKKYNDEMIKLLDKAKKIINAAKELDIELNFNFNINNDIPTSYRDIVINKNELETLRESLKKLEKEFTTKKSEKSVSDLSSFLEIKEEINGITTIITITNGYDIASLKQIASALSNQIGDNNFVLLANVNENNSVNYIAKATSNRINCGEIVKDLSVRSGGNGGGNKSFAQGGGTDATIVSKILMNVKEQINTL